MKLAIMQPYFIPYAGYFRLFAACDVFVVFDCVQFPRRGWVHRNQLVNGQGQPHWVTLPIQKCPQSTLIKDVNFAPQSAQTIAQRFSLFPDLTKTHFQNRQLERIYDCLLGLENPVASYLIKLLQEICRHIGLPFNVVRSSQLPIQPHLRGQERILAICHYLKAHTYINAPNGKDLYCPHTFKHHGVSLEFLPPYKGKMLSILHRLMYDPIDEISHDIILQSQPIAG